MYRWLPEKFLKFVTVDPLDYYVKDVLDDIAQNLTKADDSEGGIINFFGDRAFIDRT